MNLVLCEGKEDALVLQELARHLELADVLEFENYEGSANLKRNLRNLRMQARYQTGELKRLLVTRDADDAPDEAWTSMTHAIADTLRVECGKPGSWHPSAEGPEVAAWVIPGGEESGMIESLCLAAAKELQPEIFGCLEPFAACLKETRGIEPHAKEIFAYWTICGQDKDPKKRLSLQRALSHLPFNWDSPSFSSLSKVLQESAAK